MMPRRAANLVLAFLCACGCALAAGKLVSTCPKPSTAVQSSCKEVTYKDLPTGARDLLRKMKCDVRPAGPYDYGNAVDLNGDGSPEYQFCCHDAGHGPCGSVVVGKIGSEWRDLTAKEGLLGFLGACNGFVVLESQQRGFHNVCLPILCSSGAQVDSAACASTIWQYDGVRYRVSDVTVAKPSGAK